MYDRLWILVSLFAVTLAISGCPPVELDSPTPISVTSTAVIETATNSVVEQPTSTSTPTMEEISITIRGAGLAAAEETDPSIRRRSAIRSAELAADLNYAEWASGVQLDTVTVREKGIITEDEIRELVSTTIQLPCNVVEESYDDETREAEVIMECIIQNNP